MDEEHRRTESQFSAAAEVVDFAEECKPRRPPGAGAREAAAAHAAAVKILRDDLAGTQTRLTLAVMPLFLDDGAAKFETDGREQALERYRQVVADQSVVEDLDEVVARAQALTGIRDEMLEAPPARGPQAARTLRALPAGVTRARARSFRAIMERYRAAADRRAAGGRREGPDREASRDICTECGTEMMVSPETSELVCPSCGCVIQIEGAIFYTAQLYTQEGQQRPKTGAHNPNRHFQYWMTHILAREPVSEIGQKDVEGDEDGAKLIESLRGSISRQSGLILAHITVDTVRQLLREQKRQTLNKNVPLIMKRLTGHGPPNLPEDICLRVEKIFAEAVKISQQNRSPERTNLSYYPFYIYKILDAILPDDEAPGAPTTAFEHRRVLYYIYMQKAETLTNNDDEWRSICESLDEIEWVPTDREKALRYRPQV